MSVMFCFHVASIPSCLTQVQFIMSYSHFKKRLLFLNHNSTLKRFNSNCMTVCVCLCHAFQTQTRTRTHGDVIDIILQSGEFRKHCERGKLHTLAIFNFLWVERERVSVVMVCVKSSVQKSLEIHVLFI